MKSSEPIRAASYMISVTADNAMRSATVVSVTNQGMLMTRVSVTFFKGYTDDSSPVGMAAFAIPPQFTINFASRQLPDTLTVTSAIPNPELTYDEGRAIVSSMWPESTPVRSRQYTAGERDERLHAITDSKVVVYIPFGEPPAAPVPQAYRFSNPNLWSGTWDGERVSVFISASPSGLLDVVVTERNPNQPDHTYEARNLSISRAFAYNLGDIRDTVLRPLDEEMRSHVLTTLDQREDSRGLLFEFQQLGGNERSVSEFISADHPQHGVYREIGSQFIEAGGWRPQEMGGDFLRLPENATLEMYTLVADGRTIGYSLRYRRPSSSPLLFAAGATNAIDDMLYYRVVLR
jgi:hypothetical protein